PIICTVIGEGGSGGALAVGVGDHVAMLEYSIYSVISPEGCASILWRSADKAAEAAAAMGITAPRLKQLELIDEVISEPLGGAHRSPEMACETIKNSLHANLERLQNRDIDTLLESRYNRLMRYGQFKTL
ncbi:MAG: acetyl-CoA carboxylase carboxyl transferase subunit alpha, partial [Pseudomonadota bacterium]|nr:acetyl-CoA carboxylase carboxyl transferase subunit alpha [Pseudomonadota bacterium]